MKQRDRYQECVYPSPESRAALWDQTNRLLDGVLDGLPNRSPSPSLDMSAIRERLRTYDFREARDPAVTLSDVVDILASGIVHTQHPRYFGLFNPSPTFPGIVADAIASTINPQLAVWSHAPAAVEMERHVVRWLCRSVGWHDEGIGGHFTSGGAEANYTATLSALTRVEEGFSDRGARAFGGQPRIYASAESHLAWYKIAHQTGIGRAAVRLIPTDGSGRMDVGELDAAVSEDSDLGRVPVMVAATAGTTNAGMIDPLAEIRGVALRRRLWLHVDAAWGGAVRLSPTSRRLLAGIEEADSVTIDAHKWLAAPMGAGIILFRNAEILGRTFRVEASYMPEGVAELDPYTHSAQWSRRFVGLRLFLSLAILGEEGYAWMIDRGVGLAAELARLLKESDWSVVNDPSLAVVCFVDNRSGQEPSEIVARVVEEGRAWISVARFEGQAVVRACMTSHRSTEADIRELIQALNRARDDAVTSGTGSPAE
ncbi:MAG: pyridoxal phosphate-dependent decarboxylase family protein [Acidimicrobiia bacterium]